MSAGGRTLANMPNPSLLGPGLSPPCPRLLEKEGLTLTSPALDTVESHYHTDTSGSIAHTTRYLACGPVDGPLILFIHGWPELSLSWRHQLPCFAALGFRAVAPDMRGYGESSVHDSHEDYAQERIVGDMVALHEHLGGRPAVWVGHDWGSPVVWNLASHHPQRCRAVASLCVAYRTIDAGLEAAIAQVNRDIYPEADFPAGQWEYMRFYEEDFQRAERLFDSDPYAVVKALFRKGDPAGPGQPAATAYTRAHGGWFGGAAAVPDVPMDEDVVSAEELEQYATHLRSNGFFGPDSWYMNHAANAAYAGAAQDAGRLAMPVLFLAAAYDTVCDAAISPLAVAPMRALCTHLTEQTIDSGHWMAQEKPHEVNAAIARWLATEVADFWP